MSSRFGGYEDQEFIAKFCRFRVVELFGNFDKSAFSSDSPEMLFIAGKK